jgi:putative Mg2+ transporter-C (MgtC) family protein
VDLFHFEMSDLMILLHLALALALGAAIGAEREAKDKPAGLRTHMLVAAASAFLVSLGDVVINSFDAETVGNLVRSDPIRIIEAVITGVSFLGAGTIIRHRGSATVEGLTTGASLLFVSAMGMAVALGEWLVAIGATLLVLLTLRGMNLAKVWLTKRAEAIDEG